LQEIFRVAAKTVVNKNLM